MLDLKAYQKAKYINKHSNQAFYDKIHRHWEYIIKDNDLQSILWPQPFDGFRFKIPTRDPTPLKPKSNFSSDGKFNIHVLSRKLLKSMSHVAPLANNLKK